jgi:hypothetical protein
LGTGTDELLLFTLGLLTGFGDDAADELPLHPHAISVNFYYFI